MTIPLGILASAYNDSNWATGGVITSSMGYTIHTFNSSGTFNILGSQSKNVEYLIVGGGGGGGGAGGYGGGGGGAGGRLEGTILVSSPKSYIVTIGSGGVGGVNSQSRIYWYGRCRF